jgi:hypothetical protein
MALSFPWWNSWTSSKTQILNSFFKFIGYLFEYISSHFPPPSFYTVKERQVQNIRKRERLQDKLIQYSNKADRFI